MEAVLTLTTNAAVLTKADIAIVAGWGVGGMVFSTPGNGVNFNFAGGTNQFSGSPGSTQPASGQPYYNQWQYRQIATWCKAVGIKCYATVQAFNIRQPASSVSFYGPLLGNMNPSYTDPNGYTWSDWVQMCADLGDALQFMGFDGVFLDNEDALAGTAPGESTWSAGYYANSFGEAYSLAPSGTTVAQERAWAQQHGVDIMSAINNGRTDLHSPYGNNFPMLNYCSASGGRLGSFPGGVYTQFYDHGGSTVPVRYLTSGSVQYAPDVAMIDFSSYLWFMKGMASKTTAPVVFGDPFFYNYQNITSSAMPWHSTVSDTQSWANAIASDAAAFANVKNGTTIPGFTLPSNCFVTPYVWPLDGSINASFDNPTWTQSQWNSAKPAIWAGAQAGMYLIYQSSWLTYGIGIGLNYKSNSYVTPASPSTTGTATLGGGADYTLLGTSNANPPAGVATAVGVNPTVTTGSLIASGGAGTAVGVAPSVAIGPSPSTGTGTAVGVKPTITGNLVTTTTQITIYT